MEPYSCVYCLMAFEQSEELEVHVEQYHAEDPNPSDFLHGEVDIVEEDPEEIIADEPLESFVFVDPETFIGDKSEDNFNPLDIKEEIKEEPVDQAGLYGDHGENDSYNQMIESSARCHICNMHFLNPGTLSAHMKLVHAKTEKFSCDYCGMEFSAQAFLRAHEKTHFIKKEEKKRFFLCKVCIQSFKSDDALKKHQAKDHNIKIYKCSYCDIKFMHKSKQVLHEEKKHNSGRFEYPCNFCHHKFPTPWQRFTHLLKAHAEMVMDQINGKISCESSKSTCLLCNKEGNKRQLQYHVFYNICERSDDDRRKIALERKQQEKSLKKYKKSTEIYKGAIYNCDFCKKTFKHKSSFQKHISLKHPNGSKISKPKTKPKGLSTRTELGNVYKDFSVIAARSKSKKEIKLVDCEFCGFQFRFNKHRLKHIKKVHEPPKKPNPEANQKTVNKCLFCEKVILGRAEAYKHMSTEHREKANALCDSRGIHVGGPTYECVECKIKITKGNMRFHVLFNKCYEKHTPHKKKY